MDISNKNYFELFSLDESFRVDLDLLTQAYKQLQAEFHPDKVVNAEDSVRLKALQMSSIVNDAYVVLKTPLQRIAYLLTLNDIDPEENIQAHLGNDFLFQQIELREQLESLAKDENLDALDEFKSAREKEIQNLLNEFNKQYTQAAFAEGKPIYNKLQFLYKLLSEINAVEESLLDY